MTYRLSEAAQRLKGQPMFKVLSKIKEMERQGIDVVHFEIGDPDFSTPKPVVEAACRAMREGMTHYTDSMGRYEFRDLVTKNNLKTRGFSPDIDQVLITPSANMNIYYAVQCLVNPGDEVIVQDPCFPTYEAVFHLCAVKGVHVPLKEENDFRLDPVDVEKAITPKTRMVIVNSPQNPTGAIMYPAELRRIAEICIEHKIYLYSDEIYSRMNYGDIPFFSPSQVDACKKYVILANGFSKAFAMTGWRLGVCIAPADVIEKMGLLLQTTSSCVSGFIQEGGMEAIRGSQSEVKEMIRVYKERRDFLVDELNNISGISCRRPPGAFYVFPNIKDTGLTSNDFAIQALEKAHVGLLAGTDFGASGEGFVRLCYATEKAKIKEGIRRLKNFVEGLR